MSRILIIEDDELIRELYKEELTKAGFPTDGVTSGKEGLAALSSQTYDLLLLDIMLPDTNGLELLKKIKQDPENQDLIVVFITNLGQEDVLNEGLKLGATGYIVKLSYNPDQVVQEVKRYLGASQEKS